MKKSLILVLALILSSNCSAFALFGKDKTLEPEERGYVGTLPNLTKQYDTSEPAESSPIFEKTKNFHSANELKPIPREDPAFVNIILKPDKTSQYLNDLNDFILMLEKIYDSIENREDVQKFVAKVYFFKKNADYFRDKYATKPESYYESYQRVLDLSLRANAVSQLRAEAEKYKPYLAYSGAGKVYNSENIDQQLEYLKSEIESTIAVLKEAE
ncbi:TPA: hypothetical protein IAD41_08270 [Candidatus Scatenecus faecavium]|uniref:Uncharacterized protein n=1 Tax=Candidatus Scatenecus faecavium TaxID=2840915 RepID=A0A9D1FX47_9BACT|nr:hypothetical protein [Candidatus Scatenecus faecavium]